MAAWDSVGFDPGTFTDSGWGSIDQGIFGGSGSAPDYTGGQNYWDKGPIDTSPMGGTEGLYGGGGYDWGGVFGSLFKKAAQNAMSRDNSLGQPFGGKPTGNQRVSQIDPAHTLFTQGGDWSPIVIPGQKAKGFGSEIGSLGGALVGGILGGPAGAGLGMQIGGAGGSFFG
jgi:hypothetical protein